MTPPRIKFGIRFTLVAILALAFLLAVFVPRITDLSQGSSTHPPPVALAYADHLQSWVNWERRHHGLRPLRYDPCVQGYASRWAVHMARTGAFHHQSLYPIMGRCKATRSAENLVRGNVSAWALFSAWYASPAHRANILDPRLSRMGISVSYGRGGWNASQDFSN